MEVGLAIERRLGAATRNPTPIIDRATELPGQVEWIRAGSFVQR